MRTTNVFCRPSCPARKPLERNVRFFETEREALFAGFRPCRRCRPMREDDAPPWIAAIMARIDERPDERLRDGELRRDGVDPGRARRWFQARFGLTLHAYARARRLGESLRRIRNGSGRGELPIGAPTSRTGGAPIPTTMIESPLGPLVAAAVDDGICLLEFSDRRMLEQQFVILRRRFGRSAAPGDHPHFATLRRELDAYFAGDPARLDVPISAPGSRFQQSVWEAVRAIPRGQTRTYEAIARSIGSPGAARAVGRANGMNRLAILIPCHRVVTAAGTLGGYGGGIWRKEALLDLERAGTLRLVPKSPAPPDEWP